MSGQEEELSPQVEAQIEADIARVATLMRGLAKNCYKASEERGETNYRFDTIAIISIYTWDDPETERAREDVAFAFETKRHHVKTGILMDVLATQMQRVSDN